MAEKSPMPMCPMAETCRGMMGQPGSGLWMMMPGLALIALGVLILVFPQILPWLLAIALMLMGAAMLVMIGFMRRIGQRIQKTSG